MAMASAASSCFQRANSCCSCSSLSGRVSKLRMAATLQRRGGLVELRWEADLCAHSLQQAVE